MEPNISLNLVNDVQNDEMVANNTRPFVLPLWQQLIWSFVFGTMVVISVIGNIIIMWIIIAHRRMRSITNYFLLNLSVADFLMATFNAIFSVAFMMESHWPFGEAYCVFSNFLANVTVSASVFTMMAISIDRYMAIVRPLTPRMSRRTTCFIVVIIWGIASIFALPTLLYSTIRSYNYEKGEIRTICFQIWPDGPTGSSRIEYWYNVTFFLVTYVIPMIAMAIAYSCMGAVLWGSGSIGETTERQETLMKSKQKVVKMLVTVVILFGVCWLPYHVYFLYTYHYSDLVYTTYIQHVYLGIYWLAMSNSMYNPIVYYWMNAKFRAYFEIVLCWCSQRRSRNSRAQKYQDSQSFSTRSFKMTLSRTLSLKRNLKERRFANNIDCHSC